MKAFLLWLVKFWGKARRYRQELEATLADHEAQLGTAFDRIAELDAEIAANKRKKPVRKKSVRKKPVKKKARPKR